METEACGGSGTQTQACGFQAAGAPGGSPGEGGSGASSPSQSLPRSPLGGRALQEQALPEPACPTWQDMAPALWMELSGGSRGSGNEAGSPGGCSTRLLWSPPSPERGGTALNPVPLSFRTNPTMLLRKSARPSGECGACWGGASGWASPEFPAAPQPCAPPFLSADPRQHRQHRGGLGSGAVGSGGQVL